VLLETVESQLALIVDVDLHRLHGAAARHDAHTETIKTKRPTNLAQLKKHIGKDSASPLPQMKWRNTLLIRDYQTED
jgi:hypothetical protein